MLYVLYAGINIIYKYYLCIYNIFSSVSFKHGCAGQLKIFLVSITFIQYFPDSFWQVLAAKNSSALKGQSNAWKFSFALAVLPV